MVKTDVKIGGLNLKNPVLTASGTFGYGLEFADFVDLNKLGGFIVKGTGTEDVNNTEPYPTLHALVYNFLIRDSNIKRENYPEYMKTQFFNHELDYGRVYRFMMILLDLLQPTGHTELRLKVIGDKDELKAAVENDIRLCREENERLGARV
mgnify:CR=1 FL=1